MTGVPDFGSTPQQATYVRLLQAALTGDNNELHSCIDADTFAAFLPNQGRLVWEQLRTHMANLLGAAPDYGQNITVLDCLERDGALCVLYRSVFTLAGQRIEYTSTDWVTFNTGGRITELRGFYDLAGTREQAFGKRFTIGDQ